MDSTQMANTPKNNSKVIYTILITLLLGTWAYIIYDKSKTKETITIKDTQIVYVTNARDSMQMAFDIASAKLDSVNANNTQLEGALAIKNEELVKLKGNIRSILTKKNASQAELQQAREMIAELNNKISDLFAEVQKLQGENKELTAVNTQLNTDKETLTSEKNNLQQNLSASEAAKKNVEDVASTLHASNIGIAAINVKSGGKEKETTTAKRADLLRFYFDIDENRIASTGQKELFVLVYAPDGKAITNGTTFKTREDGEKPYTSRLTINYEQGKRLPVSFDWKKEGADYQIGDYKVEIYNNGYKIGEGTKTLKKGGLF
jgi:hypothetical protein